MCVSSYQMADAGVSEASVSEASVSEAGVSEAGERTGTLRAESFAFE
jgi:hypothetical protein